VLFLWRQSLLDDDSARLLALTSRTRGAKKPRLVTPRHLAD